MSEVREDTSIDDIQTIKTQPEENVGLKETEARIILETLKQNNGHRQKTAEALNLSPRTLRYKLAKFKEQGMEVS